MGIDVSNPDQPEEDLTAAWPQWFETALYILVLVFVFLVLFGVAGVVHWIWTKS